MCLTDLVLLCLPYKITSCNAKPLKSAARTRLTLNVEKGRGRRSGAATEPLLLPQDLIQLSDCAFSSLCRLWHDTRHLWDRLLPEGGEGAAACALDVSWVPQGWSLHYSLRCLVWKFPCVASLDPPASGSWVILFLVPVHCHPLPARVQRSVLHSPLSLRCSCVESIRTGRYLWDSKEWICRSSILPLLADTVFPRSGGMPEVWAFISV